MLSTKDKRDFYVRLRGVGVFGDLGYSNWKLLEVIQNSQDDKYSHVFEFNTEDTANAYGMFPGGVTLEVKARNWYIDSTYLNGTWFASSDVYHKYFN